MNFWDTRLGVAVQAVGYCTAMYVAMVLAFAALGRR